MTLIYWVSGIAAALIAARFAFNYLFPLHKPTKAEQDFDELSGGGV